jgi:RNA polymerase sigma-70 factor, ECF subfamily
MEAIDFGELYAMYSADVFRFAMYLTASHAEAEDITSETFARAIAGADTIRVGTVKAYLLTIARNLHVDSKRRQARDAELLHDPRDPGPNPEAVSAIRGELRAVTSALQQLPEVDRAAVLMRAFHNLGYEEIAAALGLTPAAVRVKVHRARLRLAVASGGDENA